MGKSASGKDHIYARLAAHEGLGLKKLVLYTTRPIRAEEENGIIARDKLPIKTLHIVEILAAGL